MFHLFSTTQLNLNDVIILLDIELAVSYAHRIGKFAPISGMPAAKRGWLMETNLHQNFLQPPPPTKR